MGGVCAKTKSKVPYFTPEEEKQLAEKYREFAIVEFEDKQLPYRNFDVVSNGREGVIRETRYDKRSMIVKHIQLHSRSYYSRPESLDLLKSVMSLKHSNIIEFKGYFIKERKFLEIYMEKLDSHIGRITPEVKESNVKSIASKYSRQILEALEYLHYKGFAHLDIKPDNILISLNAGTVKIADFGCMVKVTPQNSDAKVGTSYYKPPENLKRLPIHDIRYCDIWSLGCTIYEFVYNKRLFSGSSGFDPEIAAYNQISQFKELKELPDKDPVLLDFLRKCLAVEQDKRWNCSALLKHKFITKFSKAKPAIEEDS
jgi:serine/threonine protein kinase